jgi:hypothetical protein
MAVAVHQTVRQVQLRLQVVVEAVFPQLVEMRLVQLAERQARMVDPLVVLVRQALHKTILVDRVAEVLQQLAAYARLALILRKVLLAVEQAEVRLR